ncbi:hypothetical protein OIU79_007486 [Salix purpurea]|uniref:Uncharacterized protein n=3 Tax=Salix TaxID=40685 RepID=A0A9Q0Z3A4_SALPP|nr:hypothetical protein OIU79_007486 [Salix purpurea]
MCKTQAPMARQADRLYRIGLEGFALIDEWNGCPRRPSPAQEHQQQRYDYRGIQVPMTKMDFISNKEAAKRYGGVVIMDYRKKKSLY